jgi:hypothetical protein
MLLSTAPVDCRNAQGTHPSVSSSTGGGGGRMCRQLKIENFKLFKSHFGAKGVRGVCGGV